MDEPERDGRPPPWPGDEDPDPRDELPAETPAPNGLHTGGVRIAAVEAAVAAGLAPSTSRAPAPGAPAGGASPPARWHEPVRLSRAETAAGEPPAGAARAGSGSAGPGAPDAAGPGQGAPAAGPDAACAGGRRPQALVQADPAHILPPLEAARPGYALADWSDPPTGQVPRILLDEPGGGEAGAEPGPLPRGPSWRESGSDWDDDLDLSFLAEPEPAPPLAPLADGDDPFDFSFSELAAAGGSPGRAKPAAGAGEPWAELERPSASAEEDAAWDELLSKQPGAGAAAPPAGGLGGLLRRRGGAGRQQRAHAAGGEAGNGRTAGARRAAAPRLHQAGSRQGRPPAPAATAGEPQRAGVEGHGAEAVPALAEAPLREQGATPGGEREPARAAGGAPPELSRPRSSAPGPLARRLIPRLATGVLAGAVALAAFAAGPLATLVLVAALATVATGELLAALRRGGFRPAAPVVLLAPPAAMVAAYADGPVALPAVVAATAVAAFCFLLAARHPRAPTADAGVSVLAVVWPGMLAGYAAALLAPSIFPDRRGLAVVVAAVVLVVGNDVGAYAAGSRFGRHRLAPAVSPGKTWEGFAGGCVLTLLLAGLVAARVHPLGVDRALVLGAVVCLLGPLGDLAESLVKRGLGLKDMGDLLPAHGGVLDRVDSMLFVLPAAYYLAVAWHLG